MAPAERDRVAAVDGAEQGAGDAANDAKRHGAAGALVKDATTASIAADVIAESARQPVLVDFWAEWCRPCHMLAPTVAEIAHDYAGKVKVTKLNVDEAMNSAGRYNIRGIPTLLLFKNGQMVEQIVGAVPKDQITKAIDRHVG